MSVSHQSKEVLMNKNFTRRLALLGFAAAAISLPTTCA